MLALCVPKVSVSTNLKSSQRCNIVTCIYTCWSSAFRQGERLGQRVRGKLALHRSENERIWNFSPDQYKVFKALTLWPGRKPKRRERSLVSYRRRADRSEMVALYLEKKQICMVRVNIFIGPDGLDKAQAMMVSIAEQIAAGSLKADDVYTKRDKMLEDMGYSAPWGARR